MENPEFMKEITFIFNKQNEYSFTIIYELKKIKYGDILIYIFNQFYLFFLNSK
jgi:hypothetical protein